MGAVGAKQGPIGGDLSACRASPGVSGGPGKADPPPLASGRACLAQARHRDPAGRGYRVVPSAKCAAQAMNTAIATNWQVAAAQTKA